MTPCTDTREDNLKTFVSRFSPLVFRRQHFIAIAISIDSIDIDIRYTQRPTPGTASSHARWRNLPHPQTLSAETPQWYALIFVFMDYSNDGTGFKILLNFIRPDIELHALIP